MVGDDPRAVRLSRRWAADLGVHELNRRGRRLVYATGGTPVNPSVLAVDLEANAVLMEAILDNFTELPPVGALAQAITLLEQEVRFSGIRDMAELRTWVHLQARWLRDSVAKLRRGHTQHARVEQILCGHSPVHQ